MLSPTTVMLALCFWLVLATGCRDVAVRSSGSSGSGAVSQALGSDATFGESVDNSDTIARRRRLVRSIQTGVKVSDRVVDAMMAVPRHAFVPEMLQGSAYADEPLPIGEGQTISQPTVVAMMTQALGLRGDELVLEVGTGSGYQAAVLSRLCRRVESIEIIPSLAERARSVLARLGYENVSVRVGDGYQGLAALAPFDAIVITAAPPEIPQKLVEQLRDGGRLVVPVGPAHGEQDLVVLRKRGGEVMRSSLGPVRFVPMVRGEEAK